MGAWRDFWRRFNVRRANRRQEPLRQAIGRTQGAATRRVEQQMFEASVGMVSLMCNPKMRSTDIDRVAHRTRAELTAGHPVRLFVPLQGDSPSVEGAARASLDKVRKAVGFGVARHEDPRPLGPKRVTLVLWPPGDPPGDGGVREPRRPPPESDSEAAAAEPEP